MSDMTNPTKIADALVKAGIIIRRKVKAGHHEWFVYSYDQTAEQIITDWRVAGKLLELWPILSGFAIERDDKASDWRLRYYINGEPINEPLPRAICEAWYEAQQEASDE